MRKVLLRTAAALMLTGAALLAATETYAQTCKMDADIRPGSITIPAKINPAKEYTVRVVVENSGTCSWETGSRIRLSVRIVRGPSGSPVQRDELTPILELKSKVEPGRSITFQYEIEGPYYLGRYTLRWVMTMSNKDFGTEAEKTIEVVAPK